MFAASLTSRLLLIGALSYRAAFLPAPKTAVWDTINKLYESTKVMEPTERAAIAADAKLAQRLSTNADQVRARACSGQYLSLSLAV